MAFVAAKCTQCGADIEVDDTKEAGICQHCGTAFVTEKVINNYNTYVTNNFAGANVTINNGNNIEGLLKLAKGELQAKHYRSNDLIKYLDEIIIKFPDGSEKVKNLFDEMGLYQFAETAIECEKRIDNEYAIAKLLTKYDYENVIGWLMQWRVFRTVKEGENLILCSDELNKAKYEKEVYSYFVERGSDCNGYKDYLNAVPKEYIINNRYIQDLIIKKASTIHRVSKETERAIINQLTNMLPENRRQEISRKEPTNESSGGCYIATCVYGSYDCPQVWTLRRFRDYTLDETWYGRLFINCYYAISPALVKWFGETKWFRSFWKERLDKIVFRLNEKGVDNTYYNDRY
jgi:predicted RNA-binding Zn-ribbon protein involved in translation (DUF1610 family)